MQSIYIIVENGEPYLNAYNTYKSAVCAVKERHKEYLEDQIKQLQALYEIENLLSDINVPEDVEKNITNLYIEKGINIIIYKIPIKNNL